MSRHTSLRRTALLATAAAVLGTLAPVTAAAKPRYDVTVRMTAYGIPHIQAKDWGSLGYGYGYELAANTICTIAETYTTVRAQRSRWFGAGKSYSFRANGSTVTNLNSDFFYKQIIDDRRVEKLIGSKGPNRPRKELFQLGDGYVAGYNRYLKDVGGSKGISDPACRGAGWVTPITKMDVFRRFYQLALLASGGVAIDGTASAQPPPPGSSAKAAKIDTSQTAQRLKDGFADLLKIGSNAVAVGSDATSNGHGLLLGNPHFPWIGSERFFQAHLTIPGKLDVAGGSLLGVPLVLIGHTKHMAWSHTVSTAYRFTPFQETLVPGDPTSYLYDGVPTKMRSRSLTVEDRPGHKVSRTLWSTRHGSVFSSLLGVPLPWTPAVAFTMGDANAPNFRYLNHFFEVDRAQSSREVLSILKRNQGIPWVNTIVSDDKGEALYADVSVTPHVTNPQVQTCATALGLATFVALRLPFMDGSRSACEWGVDKDAVQKGIFGPSHMPYLIRRDYVTNSNDSYWLANPEQPLAGYDTIIGDEGTERTTRTRSGLVMVQEALFDGGKLDRQKLQDILFRDRQHSWELTKPDVLQMCKAFPDGLAPSSSGSVDVRAACRVLASWNGRDSLNARGALVFRRFWTRAMAVNAPVLGPQQRTPVWRVPFDERDPVNTPRGLNISNPAVWIAFGDAVNDLTAAGIPVDGRLGDYQVDVRPDGTRTPYHGGPGTLGVFNALNVSWDPVKGYRGQLGHGSSFIQVVQFNGTGCPDTRTILTYSQSTNTRSPHYADQTRLYSRGGWVKDQFCANDVKRATVWSMRLRG